MTTDADLTSEVGRLIAETLVAEVDSPETDLFQAGLLDSLTLVQLLLNIENRFGLRLAMDELDIDDLRSVNSIARLIGAQKVSVPATGELRAEWNS